jgi:hypothetical protein
MGASQFIGPLPDRFPTDATAGYDERP